VTVNDSLSPQGVNVLRQKNHGDYIKQANTQKAKNDVLLGFEKLKTFSSSKISD
jgi:hypothetical protein